MKTVFRVSSFLVLLVMTMCSGWTFASAANAQTVHASFKVCAYNVDGLPQKIAGISVNPDGKEAEGATNIGNYLLEKQYDIIGVSEDFDFNAQLTAPLAEAYTFGTWRGGVSSGFPKFQTDGLNFFCKKGVEMADEKWTSWNDANGYFDQGNDELIDKGFRTYTVTLEGGIYVDVYIMHMDAGDSNADIKARASQWTQLCNAIKKNTSGHPIIVMGDMNSRYTRDEVKTLFIDPLNNTGRFTVKDAWIELCKDGIYPELGADPLMVGDLGYKQGEIVDKIFYINPANGIQLTATDYIVDEAADQSDHKPLVVQFEASGSALQPTAAADWWMGEKLTDADQAAYIYNVAFKNFISNENKASVTDINEAPIWYFRGTESGTVDNDSEKDKKDGYRLHLSISIGGGGSASIAPKSGATTFSFKESESTEGAYKFVSTQKPALKSYTKYFNENSDGAYSAANTPTEQNDWLLISEKQKTAYNDYVAAFTAANRYTGNSMLPEDMKTELAALLVASTNYEQSIGSNGTTQQLTDLTKRIHDYFVATGISRTPASDSAPATIIAIYGTDGKQRTALARGINIVKMSNGTTKKIMHQ